MTCALRSQLLEGEAGGWRGRGKPRRSSEALSQKRRGRGRSLSDKLPLGSIPVPKKKSFTLFKGKFYVLNILPKT